MKEEKTDFIKRVKKGRWGYIFLIPWAVVFLVFTAYPFVYGIGISFTNYSLRSKKFVGLDNYIRMLSDEAFLRSLRGTFLYALILIPATMILALFAARVLQSMGPRFNSFAKGVFYAPSVTSQVALIIIWKFMFGPSFGVMATVFTSLGLQPISWFDNPKLSIPLIALLVVSYTAGQPVILYTAAINAIPVSYFEAAELDGATKNQIFFKITLPLVHPTTTFVFITQTINALQLFLVPYLLNDGGPLYKASTLLMMVYKNGFTKQQFGYASAVGVILFIIIAIMAALQFRAMRRESVEY